MNINKESLCLAREISEERAEQLEIKISGLIEQGVPTKYITRFVASELVRLLDDEENGFI